MAALLYLRLLKTGLKFYLATNVEGAGQLDDIVVRFEEVSGQWKTLFVQLKHKETEKLSWRMLTTTSKKYGSKFFLPNYFKSYLKIKQAMTEGKRELMFEGTLENCQIVIFTNSKAGGKLEKKPVTVSKDFSQAEKLLWSGSGCVFSFETDQEMLECLAECGDEGREFLKQLRVFCGQPSLDEMTKAVREEVLKLYPDINIERIFECFLHNVKVWWETCNEILHENHSILQTAINKVRLQTCSEQTVKEYVLPLEFEDTALLKFGDGLAYIESSETTCRLTLTKLVSSEVQCLFLTPEQLSANKTALLAECNNKVKDKKLTIIIIVNTKDSVQLDVLIEMLEIMRDTFSIVILSDGNNSIDSQLSGRFPGGFASYRDDFTMSQLKPESIDKLLETVVNMQGHEITLAMLLNANNEYLDKVLDTSLLVDILESVAPFKVGSDLPEGIDYYIARTLERPCFKSSVLQALQGTVTLQITQSQTSDKDLFGKAIDFVNSITDPPSFNHGDKDDIVNKLHLSKPIKLDPDSNDCEILIGPKFVLGFYEFDCVALQLGANKKVTALRVCTTEKAPKKGSFLFISNETNEEDFRIFSEHLVSKHLLSLKDGHLRLMKSYEDIEVIRKHIDEDQVSRFAPETAVDVEDRLVLVCAEPGMGKSTLMARLAKNTKAALPHYFVILIALNDHTKLFAEDKHEDLLEFLSLAAKMDSPLQRSLLKFALEVSGNVVVILDGFDEISPRYVQQSCHLLSSLIASKAGKIWMTSRNSVKKTLEKHVYKFSVKLREFNKEDQKDFFKKFWAEKSKKSATEQDEIIGKLLEKSSKAIRENEKSFLGIPLQCQMLAEVFEYLVDGSTENAKLPDKLDLFSLVEMFVDKKCQVFVEKLRIDSDSTDFEDRCEKEKKHFIKGLSKVGLVLILGEEELKEMGKKKIIKDASVFRNKIHQGTDKTGFVYEILNDKPRFVHRIFTEYFVAKWFSKHFEDNKKLVESKMYAPDCTVVRYFFDRTLCKLRDLEIIDEHCVTCQMPCETCGVQTHSENSPFPTLCASKLLFKGSVLHIAVLQENLEQVKTLLEREDVDVEAQDVGGRTALHLAASLGASEDQEENTRRCEILDLIIGKTRDFKVVDEVLCGSPLRYADITRWWTAIDKLLCKAGDNGQLKLTLEDVRDKDMLDTIIEQDLDKLLGFCLDNGLQVEHRYEGRGYIWREERLLVQACYKGSVKVASLLIGRNADINKIERDFDGPLIAASSQGHLEIVKLLVEKCVSTIASPSQCEVLDGETKHPDISKYINMKGENERTAIHGAAGRGLTDVITYLLSQGGDPLSRDEDNLTPLHWAAGWNKPDALRVLLEALSESQRVDVINSLDKGGNNLLHHAALGCSEECLQLLFDAGGKLCQVKSSVRYADNTRWWSAIDKLLCKTDDNGQLILTLESVRDKYMLDTIFKQDLNKLLGFCLDNGLEVDHRYKGRDWGGRLLVHACYKGSVKVASLLIERNANINKIERVEGDGPLITASFEGHLEIVKLLVEKNVSTLASSSQCEVLDGETKHPDISKYINMKDENEMTSIHWAAEQGHTDVITYLLSQGGDPLSRDMFNETPIHRAANKPNALRVLLEALSETQRVDVIHSLDKDGNTAMYHAASRGSVECLQLLFDAGGKLCQVNTGGETTLMTAARSGSQEAVKWLLENLNEKREGITLVDYINMKDKDGNTAMNDAAWGGSVECLQLLFDAGGKLCQVNCKGETTLMTAARSGSQEAVKWLLENWNEKREGISLVDFINMVDKAGNTAMYQAARGGSVECLQILFDAGGKLCQENCKGETTLMTAARRGNQEAVKWLLENWNEKREGIALVDYINMVDKAGNTAMYQAARGGSVECLQLVIDAGGKLCQVNCRGETTLMTAARRGNQEAVKWLLGNVNKEREGITLVDFINMKDKDNKTAWDKARWYLECRELIEKFNK